MKRALVLMLLTVVACLGLTVLVSTETVLPVAHRRLTLPRISAYKGWQSVGVRVHQGDRVVIRAWGEWMYTPGEIHGPEGHARYPAPDFYPLSGVPGGLLIGRIGEHGAIVPVGRRMTWIARESGLLYLRINDDILSDNDGWITLEVTVEQDEDTD